MANRNRPNLSDGTDDVRQQWLAALGRQTSDAPLTEDSPSARAWAVAQGISEADQLRALADVLGEPFHDHLPDRAADPDFVRGIDIGFARRRKIIGLVGTGAELELAIADWSGLELADVVGRRLRRPVKLLFADADAVSAAINHAYQQQSGQAQQMLDTIDRQALLDEIHRLSASEDLLDNAGRAPVIKLVNLILFEAVKQRASDIHVQPYEDRLVIRQRIDGVLFDAFTAPKALQEEILTRIKVLGRMDVAEKRLPQDGRATVQVGDRIVDLRIASLPTSYNERIVIRLLDKSARLYTLGELGMPADDLLRWQELIQHDHGMILVTGPTGSGKSTTLYATLGEINAKDLNVLTIEDPIEYRLDGISQTQINEKKGLTFATGLRSVLRQDPDIIMVGEIRDSETAIMAIQASLTGHLVFSTLHTNDAATAATRLIDLGIEPYLVASSLTASLAQRLIRRLCSTCRQPVVNTDPATIEQIGPTVYANVGCEQCRHTGYRGRLGLFEMLIVDERIRQIILQRGHAAQIRDRAVEAGMTLLQRDGHRKVRAGQTTLSEVLRVTRAAEIAEELT